MRRSKRFLAILLALMLCVSLFPATAFAEEGESTEEEASAEEIIADPAEDLAEAAEGIEFPEPTEEEKDSLDSGTAIESLLPPEEPQTATASGTCGDSLTWTLSGGTLTISGTGDMDDYTWPPNNGGPDAPWYEYRDSFTSLVIESGVTGIGVCAFCWCNNLHDVSLPGTLTRIGESAFRQLRYLNDFTIPEGVVSLGMCVFYGTPVPSISVPSTLTDIDSGSFMYCLCSDGITVDPANPSYCSESGILFSKDRSSLLFFPTGTGGVYQVPETVVTLENYCFMGNEQLEEVVIHDVVSSIGMWAFGNNYGMERITVSSNNPYYCSVDGVLYDKDITQLLVCPKGKRGTLSIPASVNSLQRDCCTNCHSLTEVILPDGLTEIGFQAFSDCFALESVTIPADVSAVRGYAFYGCGNLEDVYFLGTIAEWNAISVENGNDPLLNSLIHCSDGLIDNRSKCGDSVTWRFDANNGELSISGSGDMWNWDSDDNLPPWAKDMYSIQFLRIEDGVTGIGDCAFYNCFSLRSVETAPSVTRIGACSFFNCPLETAPISNQVTTIGDSAFENCWALSNVTIPASLTDIGTRVFYACNNLREIRFDATVAQWNDLAVDYDRVAITVHCSDGDVESLNSGSCGDNLSWQLENGVLTISGTGPMGDYDWDTVPWRSKIDTIRRVVLEPGLTSICSYAFYNCYNLREITIPASVTEIKEMAFSYCYDLSGITVDEENTEFAPLDGVLYNKTFTDLICWPDGKTIDTGIPDTVATIREYAFAGCNLDSITIPASVTEIGFWAFIDCYQLREIHFLGSAPSFNEQIFGNPAWDPQVFPTAYYPAEDSSWTEDVLQDYGGRVTWVPLVDSGLCGEELHWVLSASGELSILGSGDMNDCLRDEAPWFSRRDSISSLVVNDGVTGIGNYAFADLSALGGAALSRQTRDAMSRVSLPASLKRIGVGAFAGCTSLKELTVPLQVDTIGEGAFRGCESMDTIVFTGSAPEGDNCLEGLSVTAYYPETNESWTSEKRESYGGEVSWAAKETELLASGSCGDAASWSLFDNGLLIVSGTGDLWDFDWESSPWYGYRSGILSVIVEEGITRIGDNAFARVESVKSVSLPEGIRSIGLNAFQDCCWLPEILLPESLEEIGQGAFYGCQNLIRISIPESVSDLRSYLFYDCSSLTYVFIPASVTEIGECAFLYCTKLHEVHYGSTKEDWQKISISEEHNELDAMDIICTDGRIDNTSRCGDDLTWRFDEETGTLHIIGTGEMWDYRYSTGTKPPWTYCRDEICILDLSADITSIGNAAFAGFNNLNEVVIPERVTRLGNNAFNECRNLVSVSLPDSLLEIGVQAFIYCNSLSEIVIPNGVTSIGDAAFFECSSLSRIFIPLSVTEMGDWIFSFCGNLTEILVSEDNPNYSSYEGALYNKDQTVLLQFPGGIGGKVVVPDGVSVIGYESFYGCSRIESLVIPASVTTLEQWAFEECSVSELIFLGHAPSFGEDVFNLDTVTVCFSADDESWTEDVLQAYGGDVTWIPAHFITEELFPDPIFRRYVEENIDRDHNGLLTELEIAAVSSIDLCCSGVASLEGIQLFTVLTDLDVSGFFGTPGMLESVDLSANTMLVNLNLGFNPIGELDLSALTQLEWLNVGFCGLTELDLSANAALRELWCDDNELSDLDLSYTPLLEHLDCCGNENLAFLDIRPCPALVESYRAGGRHLEKFQGDPEMYESIWVYGGSGDEDYNLAVNNYTTVMYANPLKIIVSYYYSDLGFVNGYSGVMLEGSPVTLHAEIKEGYTFLGWYSATETDETGLPMAYGELLCETAEYDFTVDEDVSLVAAYQKDDSPSHTPGDINGDGSVNTADVALLAKYVKARAQGVTAVAEALDVNDDGSVNTADVALLAKFVKARGQGVVIY